MDKRSDNIIISCRLVHRAAFDIYSYLLLKNIKVIMLQYRACCSCSAPIASSVTGSRGRVALDFRRGYIQFFLVSIEKKEPSVISFAGPIILDLITGDPAVKADPGIAGYLIEDLGIKAWS